MPLTMQFVNKTTLPDDQVFITFQDPSITLDATYSGGTQVPRGTTKNADGKKIPNMMTNSLSLKDIGAEGLSVTTANGPVVFISFEATKKHGGFVMSADLSGPDQPSYIGSTGANYDKAYQPFEITYVEGATNGQGNLTNINYFAAPIELQSYNGGATGTKLQHRGYKHPDAKGTKALAKKLTGLCTGTNSDLATVELDGRALRIIGPSSYGAGTNPYPTFTDYLTSLNTSGTATKIQNNNAFNTDSDAQSSDNVNYNYTLEMTATVAADQTITLLGDIKTTITPNGKASYAGTTYSGAELTISPTASTSSSDIFNNTIYGQADPLGNGLGSTTFNSVWETLCKDMVKSGFFQNPAKPAKSSDVMTYVTTQNLAIGEVTTGLLGGFLGSDHKFKGGTGDYASDDGSKYKDVPSGGWWSANTLPAPDKLQPKNPYYSGYSEVIWEATGNQVYSIPYSDRFGDGPLMQTQLYEDQSVDTWVVTIHKPLFLID